MKKLFVLLCVAMLSMNAYATGPTYMLSLSYNGGIDGKGGALVAPNDNVNCLFNFVGTEPVESCIRVGDSFLITTNVDGSKTLSVPVTVGATGPAGAKGDTGLTGATGAAGISPIVNRARITTASDGTYAWTYPTACPAGTVPIIQMTPEGSAAITYNTVIVGAPTNTAASIKITQVTDVVVLTIHVLGVAPASATVVHLTAVCP